MPKPYFQTTLEQSVTCSGIGVHSGLPCSITLQPAPENTGILFIRSDLASPAHIPAGYQTVTSTNRSTTLSNSDGVSISTVEHLLASLAGMGVDNAFIQTSSGEIPILDGSSFPFCALIAQAKIRTLKSPRRYLRILKPIEIKEGDCLVRLTPSPSFSIELDVFFKNHPTIPSQGYTYFHTPNSFKSDIAPARTYGFFEDVDHLRKNGLALGSSLDNAVVYKQGKVMNSEGLRYENECVRHKILDVIGDLSLIGYPILGHFHGVSPGHTLNYRLVQALMHDTNAWELTNLNEDISSRIPLSSISSSRSPLFPATSSIA